MDNNYIFVIFFISGLGVVMRAGDNDGGGVGFMVEDGEFMVQLGARVGVFFNIHLV